MRGSAILLAVLIAAGCGWSAKRADSSSSKQDVLLLPRPSAGGKWTKLLLSPDGKTYLAQWSGECEIRVAYVVPAAGGEARAVTNYARGSAESIVVGWAGSKARVRLPQGQPPSRRPGVYLVDPESMELTLEHQEPRGTGC